MEEGAFNPTNSLRRLRKDWWKTKLCTACVSPLGRFLSRGGTCPQCGLRVCKNCRSESQAGQWVCVLCSSGGMPSDDLAKTTKSLGRDSRSIRRSWTISNPRTERAQTNSPILKSYVVLYPEEGGVTDGGSGSCDAPNGGSVSTGHLSTLGRSDHPSGSRRRAFGGSDQGLNSSNKANMRSADILGRHHRQRELGGSNVNQKKIVCNGPNEDNNGGTGKQNQLRQFHSLPRMSSSATGGLSLFAPSSSSPSARAGSLAMGSKSGKRSFHPEFDKENIKRHRSFQTTLHPYNPSSSQVNNPPSPAASVNFIEETFWDYYDYEYETSSSDPGSTPRNLRKTVTAAAISETAKRPPPHSKSQINSRFNHHRRPHQIVSESSKNCVPFQTDSNRSSCERSLGETMDYDCSLRMNHFASLSDADANDGRGNAERKEKESLYPSDYRRHGEMSVHSHPRSSYHYATISSSTNPYLPASEYVYRRRHHDHEVPNEAPPKPERKFRNSKRSVSLNAYDGRKLFSPLRTYCVLMKENMEPGNKQNDLKEDYNEPINSFNNFPSSDNNLQSDTGRNTSTTSAIVNNNSPISLSFTSTNSSQKFNSLPRERYIKIEREDGDGSSTTSKFSSLKYPTSRKTDSLLLGKAEPTNREKNVTRVPIIKDDSNNFTFTPPKTKIERSQSYREISSRPTFPYYSNGVGASASSQHTLPRHHTQLFSTSQGKATAGVDLNSIPPAGTSTLPNFRIGRGKPTTSSSFSVWDAKANCNRRNFFPSEFDDESDVVIENFIKSHSNTGNNNVAYPSTSNTLPRRKYPPTTTHISHHQPQRRASDDKEYANGSINLSDSFQQVDPSNNYFRQCSTFPRGAKKKESAENHADNVPNPPNKNGSIAPSNQRNNSPSVDKGDGFFHPSPPNKTSVMLSHVNNFPLPKQSEKILPNQMGVITGPGSSATLPHPYIRRNKQSINSNLNDGNNDNNKQRNGAQQSKESGPSISEVEMEIERDIFYQKTRSLDRGRTSKSKLKHVLSFGRGSNQAQVEANGSANLHPKEIEIDYSDSQPYNNKGRYSSLHQQSIFPIDQVDRNYANPSKAFHVQGNTANDVPKAQQVHNSGSSAPVPIPSPRLKRKAKLQQSEPTTNTSTLYSPKINGDEMSSSLKLIGPGTSYENKTPFPTSSSSTNPTHVLNELDPFSHQSQLHQEDYQRNEMEASSKTNGFTASNPISSSTSLNGSSKFSFVKEPPIKADHLLLPTALVNGNSVDRIKSEKSMSAPNHISQSSASATPNYSNSDSPGVNFMISNSLSTPVGELESQSEQQQQFSSKGKISVHSPMESPSSSSQIKSALANSSNADSSKLASTNKAVRFEPHVIAMEIESEQRKLLQQQFSGPGGGSVLTHNNNSGINSVPESVSSSGSSTGLKSNPGHHNMHRHVYANKGRQHYVHSSSSYLPVLYHSPYHQQHKYVRKGANGNLISGSSKGGKKSKKYKGFVARAIAKVKSKAQNIKKDNQASYTAAPTVYFPVQQGSKGASSMHQQQYNPPPPSSLITYISPQPQHHNQPPVQHSLEEASASQQSSNVPTITVSLTTTGEELAGSIPPEQSSNGKKYRVPGGKLKKFNGKGYKGSPKLVSGVSGVRRMDGYLDSGRSSLGEEGENQYPESFSLHMDRITPSSTSSSSTSSFSSNLQENYELFQNQTLPDSVRELVMKKASASTDQDNVKGEIEDNFDSFDEDQISDNGNEDDDGQFAFKSFDESESDTEPDFVFYPVPSRTRSKQSSSVRPSYNDTDRNRVITSVADVESHAPFPPNGNETTTKGSNYISGDGPSNQYSDFAKDSNCSRNKGKSEVTEPEPKMVVGIPTYRSPNSARRLANSHPTPPLGKSQASHPNANPTSYSPKSVNENVKQSSTSREPHPFIQPLSSASNENKTPFTSEQQRSNNNAGSISPQVITSTGMKGLPKHYLPSSSLQHGKNKNQVDENPAHISEEKSQQSFRDKKFTGRVYESAHERNVDDEDCSEKTNVNANVTSKISSQDDSCNERVVKNPPDAAKKVEGIASASNSIMSRSSPPNSTTPNRLSDLTNTTTTRASRGQDQLGAPKNAQITEDEGLRHGSRTPTTVNGSYVNRDAHPYNISTLTSNSQDGGNKLLKNHLQEEDSLVLQARTSSTSSWASNKNKAPSIQDRTQTSVTNNDGNEIQKDVERLRRLELVKKQQNLLSQSQKANFKFVKKQASPNREICDGGKNNGGRETPQQFVEQPSSLETQCANDQSVLSESEVSSGKSPSPSPRFRCKRQGGGNRAQKKFLRSPNLNNNGGGGASNERDLPGHAHHLLNSQDRRGESPLNLLEKDPPDPSGPAGMSIYPPSLSENSTSSTPNTFGKFKSRVLLNSDDLEEDEELSRAVAEAISNSKGSGRPPSSGSPPGKKNVTTVEISGDVGIVSSVPNAHNKRAFGNSFSNDKSTNSSIKPIISSEHLQSSGLSFIQQPSFLDLQSDGESLIDDVPGVNEKPIEPEIKTKLVDSASANGDNDTEKTSDDNSSDWQSESTNTVIFSGNAVDSEHPFYSTPTYNNDPEIRINNITVGDSEESFGNDSGREEANTSPTKVNNVGHKTTKVNKVSTDLIIGIKKSDKITAVGVEDSSGQSNVKIGSKRKFDKNNDISSSSSSAGDSSEELGKSNETLTDIQSDGNQDHGIQQQLIPEVEEQDHLEVEMVVHPDKKIVNGGNTIFVPGNTKSPHHRRESPEGQEQDVPDRSCSEDGKSATKSVPASNLVKEQIIEQQTPIAQVPNAKEKTMAESSGGASGPSSLDGDQNGGRKKKYSNRGTINKEKILQTMLSHIPSRSSPDGADADKSDATPEPEVESPTPATGVVDSFDVTSDEDSWVEEILFEDEDDHSFQEAVKKLPPPLDLTLHTIVEESCEESETENSGNFYQPSTSGLGGSQKNPSLSHSESNANELEKYFNFGIYSESAGGKNSIPHEESEFSDTFSESSFSLQEDDFDNGTQDGLLDPAELASTRLEKYFYNLGGPQSMMNPMSSAMMNQNADSDSVGSESDSDNSVLEKRKKVLKHHRRSADFDEEFGDKVSDEEDSFGFGQDGFDTIKKTVRKTKKSGSEGSLTNDSNSSGGNQNSSGIVIDQDNSVDVSSSIFETKSPKPFLVKSDSGSSSGKKASPIPSGSEKPVIKVNRSNSFTWSSDEEVNIMMSKLRQLIKNLIKSKAEANAQSSASQTTSDGSGNIKDKQLVYLENELIRLMKTDNLKNIVEYLSSEESDVDDVYKFIKVVNSSGSTPVDLDDLGDLGDLDIDDPNLLENLQTMQLHQDGTIAPGVSPKSSPALLAKVMHHIGNRLNMWMKDEGNLEDDNNDDNVTLKCAPSVSSDLNEDRFSWKGSFESTLAAKRQSVGSTDSISSSDYGQDKSMLRSSSLHHLTTSQPIEENKEEEEPVSSLPRMTNLCNSLPRLNQPNNQAISRAHSLVMSAGKSEQPAGTESYPVSSSVSGPVKSARYRPPGFQPSMKAKRIDTEEKASPSILSQSTPVLTQDPAILKNRSDSMGSIFHDVKPLISVKGQVEFGLQYNYKLACLEVKVAGCRDLAAADTKRNRSDPYVKAYLLPDKSKAGKRKTKTKKNTFNPVFDEILKFPLTLSDLQNRTLWLSVWHSDMFGKNEFLGEILVSLKDRVFDDPNPGWWELQEMSAMPHASIGDVVIALKWQPKTDSTGNLSVLVKEAKNLVPVKNGSPSTFVKCASLSDKTRKQKTSICRRNFNPIWNQTLLFEDVDDDGVEITIWNHDLLASHDLIGTIRLEYDNPLWESMISRPSFWVEGVLKLN